MQVLVKPSRRKRKALKEGRGAGGTETGGGGGRIGKGMGMETRILFFNVHVSFHIIIFLEKCLDSFYFKIFKQVCHQLL